MGCNRLCTPEDKEAAKQALMKTIDYREAKQKIVKEKLYPTLGALADKPDRISRILQHREEAQKAAGFAIASCNTLMLASAPPECITALAMFKRGYEPLAFDRGQQGISSVWVKDGQFVLVRSVAESLRSSTDAQERVRELLGVALGRDNQLRDRILGSNFKITTEGIAQTKTRDTMLKDVPVGQKVKLTDDVTGLRTGRDTLVLRANWGDPTPRARTESVLPPAADVGLPGYQRAHIFGARSGHETEKGILYTRPEVNQGVQNVVERYIDKQRDQFKEVYGERAQVEVTAEVEEHKESHSLKRIDYRIITKLDGKELARSEVWVEADPPGHENWEKTRHPLDPRGHTPAVRFGVVPPPG